MSNGIKDVGDDEVDDGRLNENTARRAVGRGGTADTMICDYHEDGTARPRSLNITPC
jgi:hypothetical protein